MAQLNRPHTPASTSKKSRRSPTARKISSRPSPRDVTWYNAPENSSRNGLAMPARLARQGNKSRPDPVFCPCWLSPRRQKARLEHLTVPPTRISSVLSHRDCALNCKIPSMELNPLYFVHSVCRHVAFTTMRATHHWDILNYQKALSFSVASGNPTDFSALVSAYVADDFWPITHV